MHFFSNFFLILPKGLEMRRALSYRTLTMQLALSALLVFIPEAGAKIIYVGPNETYDNIMYGLTAADPGDTVMVRDGVYVQDIKIREGVVLMAENRHGAIIGDRSDTRAMISIRQAALDGAVIDGFKFAPGNYGSIFVGDNNFDDVPSNCVIKNNLIEGRKNGIIVSLTAINTSIIGNTLRECESAIIYRGCSKGLIEDNTLEECAGWGIFFTEEDWPYEPETVLVRGNTIRNNQQGGIGIERPNVRMERNLVDGNLLGIGTNSGKHGIVLRDSNRVVNNIDHGIYIENGVDAIISSNIILGNGLRGIQSNGNISVSGNFIESNGEFGIFLSSGNANISWNEITSNGIHGIEVTGDAGEVEIRKNLINNNQEMGLMIHSGCLILENQVGENRIHGIMVSESATGVQISGNVITGNRIHGIEVMGGAGEVEIKSNLINNNQEMGLMIHSGCLILENQVGENRIHGIMVSESATGVQISGNVITGNWNGVDETYYSSGVSIEGSARVENNSIRSMDLSGIDVRSPATGVTLNQNKIENNGAGIVVRDGTGEVIISGNIISDNKEGVYSRGGPKLRNNTIQNNDEYGIRILNESIDLGNAESADSGMNVILNNTKWNLINDTPAEIPAFCNYWGLNSAVEIDSTIRDNDEDDMAGPVLFEPFLFEPGLGFPYEFIPGPFNKDGGCLRVYPNPVRRSTSIEFILREEGSVNLVIMDTSGKIVRSLVSGQFCFPGKHSVQWDACSDSGKMVTGGPFLVVLKLKQGIFSRKIIKL